MIRYTKEQLEKNQVFASRELKDQILELMAEKNSNLVINFSYTDYGGTFFDKVVSKFFQQNKELENEVDYLVENTCYFGENFWLINPELVSEMDENEIEFEGLESYYYQCEAEAVEKDVEYYNDDKNLELSEDERFQLKEFIENNCTFNVQGVEISESSVEEFVENTLNKKIA